MNNLESILVVSLCLTIVLTLWNLVFHKKTRRCWFRTFIGNFIISVFTISILVLVNLKSKWQNVLLATVAVCIGSLIVDFVLNKVWPIKS